MGYSKIVILNKYDIPYRNSIRVCYTGLSKAEKYELRVASRKLNISK